MRRDCYGVLGLWVLTILLLPSNNHAQTADSEALAAMVEQMAQTLDKLQTQVTALQGEVSTLRAENNRSVAFSAYISDEPNVGAHAGSTIPFRGVITNVGGAYSSSSSSFTAPFPGQYFFILHVDCSTDYRSASVNVNGVQVFYADNDDGDGHVTGSGLVTLKAGDVVNATHYGNSGLVDAGRESDFTGFLVK